MMIAGCRASKNKTLIFPFDDGRLERSNDRLKLKIVSVDFSRGGEDEPHQRRSSIPSASAQNTQRISQPLVP